MTKAKSEAILCAFCDEPIPEDDLAYEMRAVLRNKKPYHRTCWLATTREYSLMERLFRSQDEYKQDPETAMADLIGDLGHYCTINAIDFEEAVRRGMNYWRDEK